MPSPTINCDPASLVDAAKCFECIPRGMEGPVTIYLLNQISGLNLTPAQLVDAAKCNRCIPPGQQNEIIIWLLCQILNS